MTERYAHLAPENVRVAVKLLEGDESRSGRVEEMSKAEVKIFRPQVVH